MWFHLFQDHPIASVNEVDFKLTYIFINSQKSFVFLKFLRWRIFTLKFNESFENWMIVSMRWVQILKINVLFAKIWLKSNVLFYFKSFSFVCSCINEIHIFCFPSKLSFRFPFHFVSHSVPFSVPRFSKTQTFLRVPVDVAGRNPGLVITGAGLEFPVALLLLPQWHLFPLSVGALGWWPYHNCVTFSLLNVARNYKLLIT